MTDPAAVDSLLDRFRRWLEEGRDEFPSESASEPEVPEFGLYRLVEEFTALRHEVKLQTKGSRSLGDQTEALLTALRQAIEAFRSISPREEQAAREAGKPLAEALADLDEALDRGRDATRNARERFAESARRDFEREFDALVARQSWLRRRLVRGFHDEARELALRHLIDHPRALFDALLEGHDLIQGRLRRALAAERIERIDAVGRPVDPDRMIVVGVATDPDPDRPPGLVVEEVRRGYSWRGRLLRPAEVRASRAPT